MVMLFRHAGMRYEEAGRGRGTSNERVLYIGGGSMAVRRHPGFDDVGAPIPRDHSYFGTIEELLLFLQKKPLTIKMRTNNVSC